MSTIRQLAAIVFADFNGFTAMMRSDEFLAMQWRNRCKQKLLEETEKHFGNILDFRGNGALGDGDRLLNGLKKGLTAMKNP